MNTIASPEPILPLPQCHEFCTCSRNLASEPAAPQDSSRQNPDLVRAALEVSANAIVITDAQGAIQWVNQAFCRLTGYTHDEVGGKNLRLLKSGWHPVETYENLWGTILRGNVWQGEMINRRKDGTIYVERTTITPLKNDLEQVTHFIAVKEDITSEKAAQEALLESESRFRTIFDLAPDAIYLTDHEGRCVDANRASEQLFRKEKRDLSGQSLLDLALASDRDVATVREILARDLHGTSTGPDEMEISHADGTRLSVEVRTFPVTLGRRSLVLWVGRDITERKRLEHQYHHAQKMQAVGQLAGGVAHDFNNLLAVIRGYAELLLMEHEGLNPQTREGLEHIVQAGERAAILTRQLLVFSRKEAIEPKAQCLNNIASNLTSMLKRIIGEHIGFRTELAEGLPLVEVDTGMMEQVLVNLVINARDAMPRKGLLHIETTRVILNEGQAALRDAARAGDFVCLKVRDTGSGIAPEHLPRIFEPFFTTKAPGKGTGLGLATAYGIITQHRGWIEVHSEVGVGTEFQIYLPVVGDHHVQSQPSTTSRALVTGIETILLVEDDAAVRSIATRVLESSGYRVLEAASVPEALQVWESHRSEIALLLTDMIMPQGIMGTELSERLMASRPAIKTLFMTGYSPDHVHSEFALERPNTHFVHKPCSAHELLAAVRRSLDQ